MSKTTRSRKSKSAAEPEMSAEDKFLAKFNEAQAGQYYVRAGKGGKLVLSGAARVWKKSPDYLYITDLRLAGTEGEIRAALEGVYTEDEIASAIQGAYRAGSETSDAFKAEVTSRSAGRPVKAKKDAYVAPHSLEWYLERLDEAKAVEKVKSPKAKGRSKSPKSGKAKAKSPKSGKAKSRKSKSPKSGKPKSPKSGKAKSPKAKTVKKVDEATRAERLRERLAKLADGEVLDVSKYAADGTGAAKIKTPSGSRSKKVVLTRLSLASDNKKTMNTFLRHMGEDPAQFSDDWDASKAAHEVAKSPKAKASPKAKVTKAKAAKTTRSRSKSPKKAAAIPVSPSRDNVPIRQASRPPTVGSSRVDLPDLRSAARSPRAGSPRSPRSPKL